YFSAGLPLQRSDRLRRQHSNKLLPTTLPSRWNRLAPPGCPRASTVACRFRGRSCVAQWRSPPGVLIAGGRAQHWLTNCVALSIAIPEKRGFAPPSDEAFRSICAATGLGIRPQCLSLLISLFGIYSQDGPGGRCEGYPLARLTSRRRSQPLPFR